MRPSLPSRIIEWFQALPELFRRPAEPAAGVIAARLVAGDSLGTALAFGLPPIGAEATRVGLSAEDGPVALVCVDLLRSLDRQLQDAALQLDAAQEPWALWTAERLRNFATALEDDLGVVDVLLRMRSTVFTPADLAQTASTLGRPVRAERRLADA
ncbi:MAG: hypothetical protein MUC96_28320 [Myxococcaceae bacterium]|nr:hypothetical protein [Myxococcaceae bacterium]